MPQEISCLIVDDESAIQALLSKMLRESGVKPLTCATVAEMLTILERNAVELIFLDAALRQSDAVDGLRQLGALGYGGAIQLLSGRGADVLGELFNTGEQFGLRMRHPLGKPFRRAEIREVLHSEGLLADGAERPLLRANDVAAADGLEIMCRPLLEPPHELVCLDGRVCSPTGDSPEEMVEHVAVDAEDLLAVLVTCLARSGQLQQIASDAGTRMAISVPARLDHLCEIDIPWLHTESADDGAALNWLIIELSEDEVFDDLPAARELILKLRIQGARIRIKNAGTRFVSIAGHRKLPVQEVELNSELCSRPGQAASKQLCKIVEIIRRSGARAIAPSIPAASDPSWLERTGFDLYADPSCSALINPRDFVRRYAPRTSRLEDYLQEY